MTGPVWDGVTINPALLANYGYNDQIVYGGQTLPRFLAYMLAGINQAGLSVAAAAAGFTASSSTNTTISTGAKSLTVEANKGFEPGMLVIAWDVADPSRFMVGEVTGYTTGTGALAFTVAARDTAGTGTVTSWRVSIAGRRGVAGTVWLTGSGAPSDAAGRDGDLYFRTTTDDVFVKTAGTWGSPIANLTGQTGLTGLTGPTGPAGSGPIWAGNAGGSGNALTLTPGTPLASYALGVMYRFRAIADNTGAVTVNVSGLGVRSVLTPDGSALGGGAIRNGQFYDITDDGSAFRLMTAPGATANARAFFYGTM